MIKSNFPNKLNFNILKASFILSVLIIISCSQSPKNKLLIGTWKYAYLDISSISQNKELSEAEKVALQQYKNMLNTVSITFSSAKDFMMKVGMQSEKKGEFNIVKNKYLETTFEDGINEVQEILILTEDSLKLKSDKGLIVVYVKMKP